MERELFTPSPPRELWSRSARGGLTTPNTFNSLQLWSATSNRILCWKTHHDVLPLSTLASGAWREFQMRFDPVTLQDQAHEIVTMDDCDVSGRVRERILLHWVNSLPLTKCLLVEELRDLRFGDVLRAIVRWLQRNSMDNAGDADGNPEDETFGSDVVIERLRTVIQFAASECRSQDGDAMYIVNNVECVDRLMEGDSDAICAVLTILRRLSVQRLHTQQSIQNCKTVYQQRRDQENMIKNLLQQPRPSPIIEPTEEITGSKQKAKHSSTRQPRGASRNGAKSSKAVPQGPKPSMPAKSPIRKRTRKPVARVNTVPNSSNTKSPVERIAVTKNVLDQPNIFHDGSGLRVFSMVDPTAKPPSVSGTGGRKMVVDNSNDNELAVRFYEWVQHALQIEFPLELFFVKRGGKLILRTPRKVQQALADGNLLCQIAAGIMERYGDKVNQQKNSHLDHLTTSPMKISEAVTTFKRCGLSSEALVFVESLLRPRNHSSSKTIWEALDEIRKQFTAAKEPISQRSTASNKPILVTNQIVPNEITSHQLRSPQCVKTPSPNRNNRSGKEDPAPRRSPRKRSCPYLTNEQMHVVDEWLVQAGFNTTFGCGVLKDSKRNGVLLCQILLQLQLCLPFAFFKAPRTLSELRENISKAFVRLEKISDCRIPPCYLSATAEQAVLVGDRQVIYGILWHLWQVSREKGSSTSLLETENGGATRRSPKATDANEPIALAGRGKSPIKDDRGMFVQVRLEDSFARRLAWGNEANFNDEDDVFPIPKAPFSSPVYKDELVPTAQEQLTGIKGCNMERRNSENDLFVGNASEVATILDFDRECIESPSRRLTRSSLSSRAANYLAEESEDSVVHTAETAQLEKDELVALSPTKSVAPRREQDVELSRELVGDILSWLKRLGIQLKNSAAFYDPTARLEEFQSGVLLCCIVEKVELMRCISGVTRPSGKQQLSKASALHNISKALAMLKQKKTMPLHLLRRTNAIYAGEREIILHLLLQIRKAYGHHHAPRRRSKHPQAA